MNTQNNPAVCCVMLTCDRPALARRAVECFRNQTYTPRELLVFDMSHNFAGYTPGPGTEPDECETPAAPRGYLLYENHRQLRNQPIGFLRNMANERITSYLDSEAFPIKILCHWDDDDYSHPNRIAEQVALLQASGADAVGYNEMLFWREPKPGPSIPDPRTPYFPRPTTEPGEAWLFKGPTILGTSLCYWRSAWEKRPFEALNLGEDTKWLQGVKSKAVRALHSDPADIASGLGPVPRMVARIHAGNTSRAYDVQSMLDHPHHWTRVPEWDSYCAEVMR